MLLGHKAVLLVQQCKTQLCKVFVVVEIGVMVQQVGSWCTDL